uniref:Uncharacterized protein n=1 Tax=Eptatretus burgeri TaxID=7764 RepID=A0A8C4QHJ7_EPTBU
MPLRAQCTICSDFFDSSQSISAIFCGHVFHEAWYVLFNRMALLEQRQTADNLRELLQNSKASLSAIEKSLGESELLCSTLRKQNRFLENQAQEAKKAREETRQLHQKLKNLEKLNELFQSKDSDVEEMVHDMGSGRNAVEQLSMYCISLRREYERLKHAHQTSLEENRRTHRELHTCSTSDQPFSF